MPAAQHIERAVESHYRDVLIETPSPATRAVRPYTTGLRAARIRTLGRNVSRWAKAPRRPCGTAQGRQTGWSDGPVRTVHGSGLVEVNRLVQRSGCGQAVQPGTAGTLPTQLLGELPVIGEVVTVMVPPWR
ncbi:hypothetical protein GCM10010411_29960 [Actinomadura fulvescens]|uniref:Uncharacterized protein n=1 Tax=Actinomadura fulvescens TaxID=46160 RepID=A0ABN3PQE8_9ACTN